CDDDHEIAPAHHVYLFVGRPAVKGGRQCGERSSVVCIGVDIRRAPPGLLNVSPDGATNGERGRIDGPEWVRPPEVLTMVSNVET
ncbi:hypothetical protein T05_15624, partial [Trichinella murrelli]